MVKIYDSMQYPLFRGKIAVELFSNLNSDGLSKWPLYVKFASYKRAKEYAESMDSPTCKVRLWQICYYGEIVSL